MEGRVCLQVRIPYALSGLKIWKCFSFGIVSLAVVYFRCRLEGFVVFVLKRSEVACFGPRCLFFAMVNVAASWKSVISSLFLVGKVYFCVANL